MAGPNQLDFFAQRAQPVASPKVDSADRPRLNRQCQLILDRLKAGPATNMELIPLSTRFSARIHELRKFGYVIETDKQYDGSGITHYTLKGTR